MGQDGRGGVWSLPRGRKNNLIRVKVHGGDEGFFSLPRGLEVVRNGGFQWFCFLFFVWLTFIFLEGKAHHETSAFGCN